jgi:hypothetical protein
MKLQRMIALGMFGGGSDTTAPTFTITALSAAANVAAMRITASEQVQNFAVGDITISGGSLASFATADNIVFTVSWTLAAGANTMDIAADVCTDLAGNNNAAATQFALTNSAVPIPVAHYVVENTPTGSNTNTVTLSVRGTASNRRIMQLKPDMTGISGTVVGATLNLYTQSAEAVNQLITFNSILAANSAWIEGSSWEYAVPSTVRWAGDTGGDAGVDGGCSVSGTDYNATALGSFTHASGTPADTLNQIAFNATQVQAWLTGNYGFVGISAVDNTMEFHSDDAVTEGLRPTITVVTRP